MSATRFWLGFSLIPGIGAKRIQTLRHRFGSLQEAWNASETELTQAEIGAGAVKRIIQFRSTIDVDREIARVYSLELDILTLQDPGYPRLLREIDSPPPVLYVKGLMVAQDQTAISVVGTRNPTKYGREVARAMARELALHEFTIVSGLALGIDCIAHKGALDSDGRTIGVLGCGLDIMYPRENTELAHQIVENGALLSEFPLVRQPVGANFPRRNRIVSGLSLGTLVIEAPENSGALITAGHAADQGREVFAVPGNIFNRASVGTNRLIQDGAKLVTGAGDILEELQIAQENYQTHVRTEQFVTSNAIEAKVYDQLTADPIHIDELADICRLSIAELTAALTILELKGVAQMHSHMQYSRVYRSNYN